MNKEIMGEELGGAERPPPIINNMSLNKLMRIQDFDRDELNASNFSIEDADSIIYENLIELSQNLQCDRFCDLEMKERAAQLKEKKNNIDFREYLKNNHEFSNPESQCKEIVLCLSDQCFSP
jgi:hypothetical protein